MPKRKVRVPFAPNKVRWVDEARYRALVAQGLVREVLEVEDDERGNKGGAARGQERAEQVRGQGQKRAEEAREAAKERRREKKNSVESEAKPVDVEVSGPDQDTGNAPTAGR